MTPLARGYSFVMYQAKADATYTFPFPVLNPDHLRVFAGDTGDAVEQTFKWVGPTEIKLAGAVPEGILVTLRRFTPRSDNLVHFKDGAQLPAKDLNLAAAQLLYIMQEQIDFGTYGGSGLPGGGSGWPSQGGGTSLDLQQIIDQLMQSPVMQLLMDRVQPVDDLGETMLEELLRSDQLFDARRALDRRVALAETSIVTLTDDTRSLAQQTTELYAQYDSVAAQVIETRQALASESEARATSVTQLNAAIADNTAKITEAQQAIATETDVRATAVTTLKAEYKQADADVTTAITQTLQTTYATKDYAQSVASTQVEAWAAGNFSILQERFEALVKGSADPSGAPEWQANWTVRINAGAINGTPVIAGIGLGVDSKTGSNFIVMADRFGIVSPTYTTSGGVGQMKYPFVVGTVGGVSTVGITGQLIVDGSVTADKIKVTSLSALTANMGEVNGGTFRTYQLDANGNVIDPLEFRAELTNKPGDAYPVWVGGGAKTWNNAVFAVDRAGNAKFGGTVTAKNITDVLQRTAIVSWTSAGINAGSIPAVTLPAPVRLGESHTAVMTLSIGLVNTWNNQKNGAQVAIEYLSGSTWVSLVKKGFYLQGADNSTYSLSAIAPNLTGDTQFRVSISDSQNAAIFLTDVTGYILGVR